MIRHSFSIILLLTVSNSSLFAQNSLTTEQVSLEHIVTSLDVYQAIYNKTPSSWDEIDKVIDLSSENRPMQLRYKYRLQDQYVFINQQIVLPHTTGTSRALMVRSSPIEYIESTDGVNKSVQVRHLICHSDELGFFTTILAEHEFQSLFKDSIANNSASPKTVTFDNDQRPVDSEPSNIGMAKERDSRVATDSQSLFPVPIDVDSPSAASTKPANSSLILHQRVYSSGLLLKIACATVVILTVLIIAYYYLKK